MIHTINTTTNKNVLYCDIKLKLDAGGKVFCIYTIVYP